MYVSQVIMMYNIIVHYDVQFHYEEIEISHSPGSFAAFIKSR